MARAAGEAAVQMPVRPVAAALAASANGLPTYLPTKGPCATFAQTPDCGNSGFKPGRSHGTANTHSVVHM